MLAFLMLWHFTSREALVGFCTNCCYYYAQLTGIESFIERDMPLVYILGTPLFTSF